MSATYRRALVWAGQAIMQGKLVFNQSLSTFLSLYRFSKMLFPVCSLDGKHSTRRRDGADVIARSLLFFLFADGEVGFGLARHGNWLGLVLGAFVPYDYGVAAVRNVFDFVVGAVVALS